MVAAQADAVPERRFLIPVRKKWKLWIWPVLALLYVAWVMLVVMLPLNTGVPDQIWVLGGVGLFAFLIFVQLLLLPTVKVRRKKQKRARAAAAAAPTEAEPMMADDSAYAPPVEALIEEERAVHPVPPQVASDAEFRMTGDEHRGRRVLEVSMPPKTLNPGAVYSKAFVALDEGFVLRVEDLVADATEATG